MSARKYGFKLQHLKLKNEYIIKINGDTQEEMVQFVINLDSGHFLNDFYDF